MDKYLVQTSHRIEELENIGQADITEARLGPYRHHYSNPRGLVHGWQYNLDDAANPLSNRPLPQQGRISLSAISTSHTGSDT